MFKAFSPNDDKNEQQTFLKKITAFVSWCQRRVKQKMGRQNYASVSNDNLIIIPNVIKLSTKFWLWLRESIEMHVYLQQIHTYMYMYVCVL